MRLFCCFILLSISFVPNTGIPSPSGARKQGGARPRRARVLKIKKTYWSLYFCGIVWKKYQKIVCKKHLSNFLTIFYSQYLSKTDFKKPAPILGGVYCFRIKKEYTSLGTVSTGRRGIFKFHFNLWN